MYKALNKYKFWLILVLLFIFLRIPSLFEPYWYGDEGIYLTLGQAIRKGVTLYKNIHDNKPPTLYYLAAISQTVFGFRLLLMFFMAPAIYFFYRLSCFFLSLKASKLATLIFLVITSIPFFEGNIANAEIFMVLPTILGVYLLTKSKPSWQIILYSGILLGFAFTIKIPVVFEFAFLCLWLFISDLSSFKKVFLNLKNILIFVIAFFLPIILWGIYYYFQNALQPFIFASLLQNFGYLSSWTTGTHTSSITSGGLIGRFIILLISWLIIFLLKFKKVITNQFSFLLFWFSATIFGVLLSGRPYPHYLIQTLPPLTLIIVEIFNLKNKKNQIFSLFSFLFFVFILSKFKFYFYPVFKYYSNFYSYSIGLKSTSEYRNFFGSQTSDIYQISDFIQSNSKSTDRIFVWGDQAYIYALSNRLPSTKYIASYHMADFDGYQDSIDKIKAYTPKFIVYYSMPDRSFPELDFLIKKYYFVSRIIGDATIYQIR